MGTQHMVVERWCLDNLHWNRPKGSLEAMHQDPAKIHPGKQFQDFLLQENTKDILRGLSKDHSEIRHQDRLKKDLSQGRLLSHSWRFQANRKCEGRR